MSQYLVSNEQAWMDRMGHWIHLDGQWTNMDAQWTILNMWWKDWMAMIGQIWVDSGEVLMDSGKPKTFRP